MLFQSSQDKKFQADLKIKLHPLHYLSLNAYIMLASAYRTRLCNLLTIYVDGGNNFEVFESGRAAVSYSLLLAGAAHHLFLSEPSLIATTAHFLLSAAESIFSLLKIPECSLNEQLLKSEMDSIFCHYHSGMMELTLDACNATSMRFLECISQILLCTWPILIHGLRYLENIKSPINFRWLGLKIQTPQCFACHKETSDFIKQEFSECHGDSFVKDQSRWTIAY
ncbi:protein SET DOMAIN GROUP 41 isoform X1 [Canna indica]|uniref:Protein SET DOMAIN GROUP 41 isoform X1 n=1 Tax=Canna indica TaxID=4628 RepID=A0AAQ3KM78_9LILI|nr:protein SET DOMAIN GROUP 41 isoform X1 [Canna indica]